MYYTINDRFPQSGASVAAQDTQRATNPHLGKSLNLMPHRGTQLLGSSNWVTWSQQAFDNGKSTSASHWSQALGLAGCLPAVCWFLSALSCVGRIPYSLSLKSEWECFQESYRHSQQKAMTWQQSQDPKRPAPPQTQLRSRWESPSNWRMELDFQKALACWVPESCNEGIRSKRHLSLDIFPSSFILRWWDMNKSSCLLHV